MGGGPCRENLLCGRNRGASSFSCRILFRTPLTVPESQMIFQVKQERLSGRYLFLVEISHVYVLI